MQLTSAQQLLFDNACQLHQTAGMNQALNSLTTSIPPYPEKPGEQPVLEMPQFANKIQLDSWVNSEAIELWQADVTNWFVMNTRYTEKVFERKQIENNTWVARKAFLLDAVGAGAMPEKFQEKLWGKAIDMGGNWDDIYLNMDSLMDIVRD